MRPLEQCSTCGAFIFWATTAANGRAIPIDAAPEPTGNVDIEPSHDPREAPIAHVLGAREAIHTSHPRFTRHVSHFSTCPDAPLHRKARP